MNKYWIISKEIKIPYEDLFKEIKESLSDWEVKLIWYLRNSHRHTTFEFFNLAKKLYAVNQAETRLSKPLKNKIPTV